MRCLGRIVFAFLLVLLLAAGWLYRTELVRWGRGVIDPLSVVRRTGHPSPVAAASAKPTRRVASNDALLQRFKADLNLSGEQTEKLAMVLGDYRHFFNNYDCVFWIICIISSPLWNRITLKLANQLYV